MKAKTSIPTLNDIGIPKSLKNKDTNDFLKRLLEVDLEPIKFKLVNPENGRGWSIPKVDAVEVRYKAFLLLTCLYPDTPIVPTSDIDHFWHAHILDTEKYRLDCDHLFGHFLDHFPYFGVRSEDDAKELRTAFTKTVELFNTVLPSFEGVQPMACGSDCGASLCEPHSCGSNACARPMSGRFKERPRLNREPKKITPKRKS